MRILEICFISGPRWDRISSYPSASTKVVSSRSTARVIRQQAEQRGTVPDECTQVQTPSSYVRIVSLCRRIKTILQLSNVAGGGIYEQARRFEQGNWGYHCAYTKIRLVSYGSLNVMSFSIYICQSIRKRPPVGGT